MRLARYLRTAGNVLAYRADAFDWRRSLQKYRHPSGDRHDVNVLFCDVMTSYAVSKAQSLFAVAFRDLGYDSTVLLERPDSTIERNYRSADVSNFVYFSDFLPDQKETRQRAEEIISQFNDINEILDLEIDGVRVGRNVLSKTVRNFRVGRLNGGDHEHRKVTIDNLSFSLSSMRAAYRILKDIHARAAFFCERGYTPAGEVFDVCTRIGIDAIQWAAAPMNGTLLFKRYDASNRAVHALSLSDDSWQRVRSMPWSERHDTELLDQIASHYETGAWYNRQRLQAGKKIQSRREVEESLSLNPDKKTAVVFCHILYDATFFYGKSLFQDYQTWLVETVRSAIANPELNWVVKAHPVNVWRSQMDGVAAEPLERNAIHQALGALPDHIRFMPADTPINTYSLFGVADYGLTVRGTIGLELPCYGIPVVTAGTGRYAGHGFTIDPETQSDYRTLLAGLHDVPRLDEEKTNLARRYAYATLRWRPLPLSTLSYQYNLGNWLAPTFKSNVKLEPSASCDLMATPDIGRMARWALESSVVDLTAPEADQQIGAVEQPDACAIM